MKRWISAALAFAGFAALTVPAHAGLISVTGAMSSVGTAPAIIGAPSSILDDTAINTGMQGFNEAQNVVTTVAHGIDGGGSIAAGSRVDSHMIFLNSLGGSALSHFDVIWTFSGEILGIMSDPGGTLESASTFELGNPGTNYTSTFPGSGPAAPFNARGLESNNGGGGPFPADGYSLIAPNQLLVGMSVTEPGDWIRVVTATPVPTPSTITLLGVVLAGLGLGLGLNRRRLASA